MNVSIDNHYRHQFNHLQRPIILSLNQSGTSTGLCGCWLWAASGDYGSSKWRHSNFESKRKIHPKYALIALTDVLTTILYTIQHNWLCPNYKFVGMTNVTKKQRGDWLAKWLMLGFMDLRWPRVCWHSMSVLDFAHCVLFGPDMASHVFNIPCINLDLFTIDCIGPISMIFLCIKTQILFQC